MRSNCSSCGAPAQTGGIVASFKCDYCQCTTYNEDYVNSFLENVDLSKFSNKMRLAKVAFESENYADSAERFKSALEEHADSAEAWAFRGLSLAHDVDLSNIHKLPKEIGVCFKQAKALNSEQELVETAEHVAQELIIATVFRIATGAYDEAHKILFAFADQAQLARQQAGSQYQLAFDACGACLERPSSAIGQMLDVSILVIKMSRERSGMSSSVVAAAQAYIDTVRREHPEIQISLPAERKAACFPGDVLVATPRGNIAIANVRAGDLVFVWCELSRRRQVHPVKRVLRCDLANVVAIATHDSELRATLSHTLLTGRGWLAVQDLRAGDELIGIDVNGHEYRREVIAVTPQLKAEPVYNLHTAQHSVFIAGGFVAHNFTHLRPLRTFTARVAEGPFGVLAVQDWGRPARATAI